MNLSDWASIAAIIGALLAAALLGYTAYQVNLTGRVSRAQFWLDLEKMFSKHDEVHLRLRPGGDWSDGHSGPTSAREWAAVEDYMGLFEHCELMIRKHLLDIQTFQSIFSYRIQNIVRNRTIAKAKLIDRRDSWKVFIELCNRLEIPVPTASDA